MTPDVSALLCTRNRGPQLAVFLSRLAVGELAQVNGELVIVDNGSSDDTRGVAETFARRADIPVQLVSEPVAGISRARNAGLRVARGDLIVLLDDDAYPADGFFLEAVRLARTSPHDFFGGRVLAADPNAARTSINECTDRLTFSDAAILEAGSIHGCSLILRRSVLERIGLFHPALGAGTPIPSAEDYEILLRAIGAGMTGAFEPSLVVHHDHGREDGSADAKRVRRWYDYGRGAACMSRVLQGDRRYLAYWLRRFRYMPARSTIRELIGGARYALRRHRTPPTLA